MPKRAVKRSDTVKVSFLLNQKKCKALDEIAASVDRDRTYILNEAISAYLEVQRWQLQDTRKAIQEAVSGDFASEKEVADAFAKYIHNES